MNLKFNKSKRGQITFFIIAGIVILIAALIIFILKDITTIVTPDRIVPPELVPVDKYITECIDTSARDAINLIGINGGYLRFPSEIESDPSAYIPTNPIFKKDIKVPLWRYRGESRMPSEDQMKEEIEWYIEQQLPECLNGLQVFSSMFRIVPKKDFSVNVDLLEKGVSVEMDYPLEISSLSTTQVTLLNGFKVIVPTRLKTMYELARKVMQTEDNDMFIERRTLDLIAMDISIPYTDVEFSCKPKQWRVSEVKNKIKTLMNINLPYIKVDQTSYSKIPDSMPYMKNHYVWKVTDTEYPSTTIGFSYDEKWPFFLKVSPSEGDMLFSYPTRGFDVMSFFCMNLWHFTYDLRYPVMVTIKDQKTADHDDYTFNFAFDAGINHNLPDKTNFYTSDYISGKASEDAFCNQASKNVLTVRTFENISRSGYEDHVELPGVKLTFTCLKMRCPLGDSEVQFRGADVFSVSEVPYCIEGLLIGEKEGYLTSKSFVSTVRDTETELFMTPVIRKNITVAVHSILSTGNILNEEQLEKTSSVVLTVKRPGFTRSAFYPVVFNSTEASMDISSELELLGKEDYTYQVTAYLIDDTNNLLGGYRGNWTPSWAELENAGKIKFHVLKIPYTRNEEEIMVFLQNLDQDSSQIPEPEMIS